MTTNALVRFTSLSALGLALVACGGGAKVDAKTPTGAPAPGSPEAAASGPATSQVATTASGQQYAASDAPTAAAPEAPKRPPMNAAAMQAYQAGLQAFQAGDLAGAKAQFSRAAEADANAYQAQFSLGVVQERLGNKTQALASYRQAFGIVKDYEPAIAAYSMLLARTGDASEAEDFLNRERAMLPDSAAVLASLAEVKSIQKDSGAAQQLAQEALKKNPDYRPAMVTLARDHYRNRRLDLALYALTAILDGYGPENPPRDKDNAEALLLRGLIYKEQNKRRQAFADFKRATELRPDLVEAKLNLAKYMLEAGNATEAVPLLENALGYDASNTLVHLNLGDAYRLQGRPADSLKHFQWVLSKDPTNAEVHYDLGLLYLFSTGVPGVTPTTAIDKAIAELEQFKAMRPRTKAGAGDDTDELLGRAKNKKAILAAEAASPPPEPAPAAAPAPAPGAAAPAATPAAPATQATATGKMDAAPAAAAPVKPAAAGAAPPPLTGGATGGAPAAPAPAGSAGSSAAFPQK
ncbi:MAG TPA: tetratricopeptide repeat protein [Polyangiaceae bacterium]|nr:tetratricopeptide repeat protein [Polyangiaceae bacterium]